MQQQLWKHSRRALKTNVKRPKLLHWSLRMKIAGQVNLPYAHGSICFKNYCHHPDLRSLRFWKGSRHLVHLLWHCCQVQRSACQATTVHRQNRQPSTVPTKMITSDSVNTQYATIATCPAQSVFRCGGNDQERKNSLSLKVSAHRVKGQQHLPQIACTGLDGKASLCLPTDGHHVG